MSRRSADKAIGNVYEELSTIAHMLYSYNLCADVQPLRIANGNISYDYNNSRWSYQMDNLLFKPELKDLEDMRFIPDVVIDLSVELSVKLEAQVWEEDQIGDPFTSLSLNILLTGKTKDRKPLFFCYHLDRDDYTSGGSANFVHPIYHFHYGGYNMTSFLGEKDRSGKKTHDIGNILIVDTPRFIHPPMDIVLGIDFILTNFFPKRKLSIRQDNEYMRHIIAAQKRCWMPYVRSLAEAWMGPSEVCRWEYRNIWPQMY